MALTSIFSTLRGENYRIEINGAGDGELTLSGDNPVTIEYDQDSIFKPLKMSGCSITVLTSAPLMSLYTGTLNGINCKIYRGSYNGTTFTDEALIWFGFLTPNVYSSGYKDVLDEMTLEFVDPLSAMENVKFKKSGDDFFLTFKEFIQNALEAVGAADIITNIDVSDAITVDIEEVGCMQRNFIDETEDEDDGAMTWQEVMESIAQYLNMTFCIYGDTLHIIDPLATGEESQSIANIGIAEGNGQISLGDVYNKVTVVANNNPIDNTIPDVLDNDDLIGIMADDADYLKTTYTSHADEAEEYTKLNAFFKNGQWVYASPLGSSLIFSGDTTSTISQSQVQDAEPVAGSTGSKLLSGIYVQKFFDYKTADGDPASISWSTVLTMGEVNPLQHIEDIYPLQHYYGADGEESDVYVSLPIGPWFIGQGGYFILSMEYMFSNIRVFANSAPYAWTPETYGEALPYVDSSIKAGFRDDKFKVQLKVGDMYYNGSEWTETESTFYITHKNEEGDKVFGEQKSIDNTVSYQWNLANSEEGFAIPLPEEVLFGRIEFKVWADSRIGGMAQDPEAGCITSQDQGYNKYDGIVYNSSPIVAIHISSLSLKYTTRDTVQDIYNLTEYDADLTYTNICDEDNVKDADDIDFTTNTYTSRAVSYSYALKYDSDTEKYSYVEATKDTMNQEQQCIKRNVEYYSQPRLKYQNTLCDKKGNHLLPWSNVTIPAFSGRKFTIGSVTFNLAEDSAEVTLLEI